MARKSRKHQTVTLPHLHSETAGYIRLSVTGKGGDDSIENQKKVIEAWAQENQHPISRWYIDAGWSGRTFDRPKFRELIADIERGEVDCVVVKDLSRLGRDHIAVGYYLEVFFPMNCVRFVSINDYFDTVDGLTDGTGDWNSRSVKYILTNRTYTGMLVQGKEKRVVKGTHEPLVDVETFDRIQSEFKARSFNISPTPTADENIFKGKVICACCGGKMQRKRGTNHADWHFFTCITKNRLGADKCTGMYAREEDVLSAVYYQLKRYIDHHFITKDQYQQEIQHLNSIIEAASLKYEEATDFSMKQYEKYVMGEGSKEAIAAARPAKEQAEAELNRAIADKEVYEKQYRVFCKLLKASRKEVPLSEIIDCIERIVVDVDRRIVVKWTE